MLNFIQENLFLALLLASLIALVLVINFLKHPDWGIYLTFFATGILLSPNLPIVREKLTAAEFFMALTWMVIFLRSVNSPKQPPLTKPQSIAVFSGGVFIAWVVLSFVVNSIIYPASITNSFDSLIETCNFIYGYLMFLTVALMVRDWNKWKNCLNGWLLGAVVVCIFGTWGLLGHAPSWTYDEFTHRACSTLRRENQVPSFLLPIFVVLVFMIVQRGRKAGERWALTVLLIGVFLTSIANGSRTSLLMMIVAGVEIWYVKARESRYNAFNSGRLTRISFFVFWGFIVYVVLALAGYKGDYSLGNTPGWKRPVVLLYEWSRGTRDLDENRTAQLKFVYENIWDNLVLGTGPKIYAQIYRTEEIHNTYAGVLLQTGIPGLALFLIWLWLVIHTGWRASSQIRIPHQRLMILSMVMGMTLLLLYSLGMFGLRQRNIWLLAGLLVAADSFVPRRNPQRAPVQGYGVKNSAGPAALPPSEPPGFPLVDLGRKS